MSATTSDRKRAGNLPVQAAILVLSALLLGTLANLISPRRIHWTENWDQYIENRARNAGVALVTLPEVRRIVEAGTYILLDARPLLDYSTGHIPGALSLPHENAETDFPQIEPILFPAQPILVYCSGAQCDESLLLAQFLGERGYTNLYLYPGGYDEWQREAEAGGTP